MLHKYMWCLICLVSPVLVKVYDVFPWLMYGQVRQPCLELQRNVPTGGLGVLLLFESFTRTSRSRSLLLERRKVTTCTSLKMFLKRSVDCWMGCFLRRPRHSSTPSNWSRPRHSSTPSNSSRPGHKSRPTHSSTPSNWSSRPRHSSTPSYWGKTVKTQKQAKTHK